MKPKLNPKFKLAFLCPKFWGIWFGLLLLKILSFLPYRIKLKAGAILGKLFLLLGKRRPALARANLKLAFPEKSSNEREEILVKHFESLGISLFESMIVWWGDHRKHTQNCFESTLIQYEGLENLEQAQQSGKGIILLVPHFTTTDIIGLFLSFKMSLNPVYRPHDNLLMDYLIAKGRTLANMQPTSKYHLRSMLSILRNGQILGFLPDQKYTDKGHINVPFFGKEAPSNPATTKLAKMTDSIVLPAFLTRHDNLTYTLKFLPPLKNFPGKNEYEDTLKLHQLYEQEIKKNPAQYLWTHDRWGIKNQIT